MAFMDWKEEFSRTNKVVELKEKIETGEISLDCALRKLVDESAERQRVLEALRQNLSDAQWQRDDLLYKLCHPPKMMYAVPENKLVPTRIIVNGPATIIFWKDGKKTVVKCAEGEPYSLYNAFTASLALRLFGKNTAMKKLIRKITTVQAPPEDAEGLWAYVSKEDK